MMNKILFSLLFAINASAGTPNDPLFSRQWALANDGSEIDMIDFDNLHTIFQKGTPGVDIGWSTFQSQSAKLAKAPVIVAVIDSGIDSTHPDLAGRISKDSFDFINQSSNISDDTGHGTEVAGVIVANSGNGIGISGIAPASVSVMALRVLGVDGMYQNFVYKNKFLSDYAADAIRYAVAHKASIINMSFGWPTLADNDNVRKAVSDAVAAGVLIVTAAGNDRKSNPSFPCTYEGVICVGSVGNTAATTYYSNFGGLVDIVAPGNDVISTLPFTLNSKILDMVGYESVAGTSISSPIVAAVAATIKSVYPNISLAELRARLLASTSMKNPALALYGIVNIAKAITIAPQPVFYPHFKGHDEIVVNEKTLTISDSLVIENMWADANNVSVKIMVNSKLAGQQQIASLAKTKSITVPWSYQFASLDESSLPKLSVQINSSNGGTQNFSLDLTSVRSTSTFAQKKVIPIAGINASDWVQSSGNLSRSNLKTLTRFGETTGTPLFYIVGTADTDGLNVQIFDPLANPQVHSVKVTGIQKIGEVLQLKQANYTWVVTGTKSVGNQEYLVFSFLNDQFQNVMTWQLQLNALEFQLALRTYSDTSNWISYNGMLIPSFFGYNQLPPPDNYDGLDPRHTQNAAHLYYLLPIASANSLNQMDLQLRALDSKTLRDQYPSFNILNLVPQVDQDKKAGHIRALVSTGTNVNSPMLLWDITSVASQQLIPAAGWDVPSASGNYHKVLTANLNGETGALNNLFDGESGSLTWLSSNGHFLKRTEYIYKSSENQLTSDGVIGVYQLPNQTKAWFVESRYDLVGYYQSQNLTTPKLLQTSLDRDSTFSDTQIDSLLSPVLLGTTANPVPGLFIDSTLVRGDLLAIASLNPQSGELKKALRYSLQMPKSTTTSACLQMGTFYSSAKVESLSLGILCRNNSQLEFHILSIK